MKVALFIVPLLIAGCGTPDPRQSGGLTKREAEELDAAAEALDRKEPVPSLANTPIPAVPAPPADPEIDGAPR